MLRYLPPLIAYIATCDTPKGVRRPEHTGP